MFDRVKPIDLLENCEFLDIGKPVSITYKTGHLWWKREGTLQRARLDGIFCRKARGGFGGNSPCTIADQARCPLVDRV